MDTYLESFMGVGSKSGLLIVMEIVVEIEFISLKFV